MPFFREPFVAVKTLSQINKISILACMCIWTLSGCDVQQADQKNQQAQKLDQQQSNQQQNNQQSQLNVDSARPYEQEFQLWKEGQDQKQIQQYQDYFKAKLKHPPNLYELTLNSHPLQAECVQYRFALPPQKYWPNLLSALKVVETLQSQGLYANYKIVSVYRSPEANICVRGAKASKHLTNHAVDFETLDQDGNPYPDTTLVDQKLCHFWRKQGKALKLGLGLYGQQRYHIDTQAYRTWGVGYGSATSPCLNQP